MSNVRFQSTRPHGARRRCMMTTASQKGCFNPRARTGRDKHCELFLLQPIRFNPRARTGRDFSATYRFLIVPCFNPRARTGRDCVLYKYRQHGQLREVLREAAALPDPGRRNRLRGTGNAL